MARYTTYSVCNIQMVLQRGTLKDKKRNKTVFVSTLQIKTVPVRENGLSQRHPNTNLGVVLDIKMLRKS